MIKLKQRKNTFCQNDIREFIKTYENPNSLRGGTLSYETALYLRNNIFSLFNNNGVIAGYDGEIKPYAPKIKVLDCLAKMLKLRTGYKFFIDDFTEFCEDHCVDIRHFANHPPNWKDYGGFVLIADRTCVRDEIYPSYQLLNLVEAWLVSKTKFEIKLTAKATKRLFKLLGKMKKLKVNKAQNLINKWSDSGIDSATFPFGINYYDPLVLFQSTLEVSDYTTVEADEICSQLKLYLLQNYKPHSLIFDSPMELNGHFMTPTCENAHSFWKNNHFGDKIFHLAVHMTDFVNNLSNSQTQP